MNSTETIEGTRLEERKAAARAWFEALQARIIAALESIEDLCPGPFDPEAPDAPGRFTRKPWTRADHTGAPGGGGSGDNPVALEPHLLRGKVVRQRMLVPDALGGNIGIMTMAPVVPKPVSAPSPEKREANADRWYLITQR